MILISVTEWNEDDLIGKHADTKFRTIADIQIKTIADTEFRTIADIQIRTIADTGFRTIAYIRIIEQFQTWDFEQLHTVHSNYRTVSDTEFRTIADIQIRTIALSTEFRPVVWSDIW